MQDISKHPIFQALQKIIHDAADVIMDIYQRADLGIEQKLDDSPVTAADLAAHKVILAGLQALTPDIPVLSEEGVVSFEERSGWPMLWIVDPLDGTKEFIKRNGEFSINIALVENGVPILGVVYLPTTSEGYVGVTESWKGLPVGAFKWQGNEFESIKLRDPRDPIIVMTSRSHGPALPADLKATLKLAYEQVRELPKGSSIKGCRIAEGIADLHLRRGPTSEWDTAAQQAIIEAAGGMLVTPTGQPFRYNQRKTLLNGHFFVSGPELAPSVIDWYKKQD
ncbi:3'(2'),5'-bisphosphate nucleotidase CysQ [Marinomonas primoryensis]|jgi:3'(2'), 5'-bisphosphate nucleotidase|uniref:3'(2'),5'-bisphosphate nucleotidase CysQ n=1 Tax=Marinomonas primoryensis TaxID=178399 RepID=A0A859CS20_9GAMM|nr:3'(2'),5'-bisphosphate nucleotidase CysQ [Marinomonas primoryensis]QKK78777.1 3'(2'),5'-bisphosphate nucleotidase [Marinomonas primoryensis]|tara:strand:- start:11943 stop:12782 length:840 start_codon:yes stop_codon:yes gene_type:complete